MVLERHQSLDLNSAFVSVKIEMSSLCPHQFQEYLGKVSEILETYKSQIIAMVEYTEISNALLNRKVIKKREHAEILNTLEGNEQMLRVLQIVKTRMWGLENFMTALIDLNKSIWLNEELFQAYVKHLAGSMKKLQTESICECFHGGKNSILYTSWLKALSKFDGYLDKIGTSLGFLTNTIHPVSSTLDFIRNKLPISRQKVITVTQADLETDSSEDDEIEDQTNSAATESSSVSVQAPGPVTPDPKILTSRNNSNSKERISSARTLNAKGNLSGFPKPVPGRSGRTAIPKQLVQPAVQASKSVYHPNKSKDLNSTKNCQTNLDSGVPTPVPDLVNKSTEASVAAYPLSSYDYTIPTSTFQSVSLISTSSEEDLDLTCASPVLFNEDGSPYISTPAVTSATTTSSPFSSTELIWDDDAVFPNSQIVQPLASTPKIMEGDTIALNPSVPNVKKIKINGSIRTLQNPALTVSGNSAFKKPIPRPPVPIPAYDRESQYFDPSQNQATSKSVKPIQNVAVAGSSKGNQQASLVHSSEELKPTKKSSVESVSICTQTSPIQSRRLTRSNSFPYRSMDFMYNIGDGNPIAAFHSNVFRSFEIQKPGSNLIVEALPHESNNNENEIASNSNVEKKPFLKKNSGRLSVAKKFSAAFSSVASTFKPDKKILRSSSTSLTKATPSNSKTLPVRHTSVPSPTPSTSAAKKPIVKPQNKSVSTSKTLSVKSPSIPKPVIRKTPEIPARERIQSEIREKKANAPPPPPPKNEDRLAPKDYNFQEWSNARTAKKAESGEVKSVATQNV